MGETITAAEAAAELIDVTSEKNALGADRPRSCSGSIQPLDLVEGQLVSKVKTARDYFMYSTDPAAGSTYEGRLKNLKAAIATTFIAYVKDRSAEYVQVQCEYYGVDWNQAGNYSWKTMTCEPGFYFLVSTLKRTQNGDWKAGPVWGPNEAQPTSLSWRTGGHSRSETFAQVHAMYQPSHIRNVVINELEGVRRKLHDLGIPTDLPQSL